MRNEEQGLRKEEEEEEELLNAHLVPSQKHLIFRQEVKCRNNSKEKKKMEEKNMEEAKITSGPKISIGDLNSSL